MQCLKQSAVLATGGYILLVFGFALWLRGGSRQEKEFRVFMKHFNKSYGNESEYQLRFAAFLKSLNLIDALNAKRNHNASALYGLTTFADMDADEFSTYHLQTNYYDDEHVRRTPQSSIRKKTTRKRRRHSGDDDDDDVSQLPRRVDWRTRGAVTPVNNQYACGACWAFSAIETIESMHAIRTGKLIALSKQQMIDCAAYDNNGCNGGDVCSLFAWLTDYNISVYAEADYPLHLRTEQCRMPLTSKTTSVHLVSFECDTLVDQEDYLLAMISRGPVAVAINAITWQYYLGGVIQYHCSDDVHLMNHAVQVVGYDLDAAIPHYVVRNSWGESFGDGGYLYIAIDGNLCGIANEVSTAEV